MHTDNDSHLQIQCPMPEILKLLGAGRRGEAIKLYGQIAGCSLKRAGAAIRKIQLERLGSELNVEEPIHEIVRRLVKEIDARIQYPRDFKLHIQYAATPREGERDCDDDQYE
jgi:hypothetical protein